MSGFGTLKTADLAMIALRLMNLFGSIGHVGRFDP